MLRKKHPDRYWKRSVPRYRFLRWQISQRLAQAGAVGLLVTVVVVVLAIGNLRQNQVSLPPGSPSEESTDPTGPIESSITQQHHRLPVILDRHRKATGLASVNSLAIRGHLLLEERYFRFSLLVRRPLFFKQSLHARNQSASLRFNGSSFVPSINGERFGDEDETQQLNTPLNHHSLLLEGAFGQLVWEEGNPAGTSRFLGVESFRDREALLLEKPILPGIPIHYYLDPDSHLVLGRSIQFDMNGQSILLELHLDDYQTADGLTFPRAYTLFRNGEKVVSATFESIDTDIGILPEVFE
ncbi:MAG: hypothetical protein R6V45_12295 [Oceanipulchritudo sp.]